MQADRRALGPIVQNQSQKGNACQLLISAPIFRASIGGSDINTQALYHPNTHTYRVALGRISLKSSGQHGHHEPVLLPARPTPSPVPSVRIELAS